MKNVLCRSEEGWRKACWVSLVASLGEDRHEDEGAPKHGQPGQQPAEVIAGRGEDGVAGIAVCALEEVAVHVVIRLRVADDRASTAWR